MIHEFWGLNPDIVSKADLLAQEGYLVVAPDVFRGSTTGYVPTAIYQVISTPADEINQDLDAVVAWTNSQPEADPRGSESSASASGAQLAAVQPAQPHAAGHAVFYGEPVTDPTRLARLEGPVLGIFGGRMPRSRSRT